ncbi:MAG: magnesium transporter [Methanobrevibacter sp.]|jgi:mgtE-like transporter|nr:magnesium transporter [Candidatus Methanovirga basalitermitum]
MSKALLKFIRHFISNITLIFINLTIYISKKGLSLFTKTEGKSFLKTNKAMLTQSLIGLLICAFGDLFAGIILGNMTLYLESFPGLIVLIPGSIGMRGNIYGALASRIGTNLHIGTLSPELKKSDVLSQNIQSSIILTLILSISLGILAKITCRLLNFNSMSLVDFIIISSFGGLISSLVMLPTTIIIPIKSFQNGWDPDNITTPIITALGDLFTLPSILIAIYITLLIHNQILKIIVTTLIFIFTLLSFYFAYNSSSTMKKILKQNTPILFLSSLMGISAGQILNMFMPTLLRNQSLLSLVPIFSGESGGLLSILSSRLTSAIHLGIIKPTYKLSKELRENFKLILVLATIIYPLIAILVESLLYFLGTSQLSFITMILISTISGLVLIPILIFVVFNVSIFSYLHGLDPDNIDIPFETSLTDFLSNIVLIAVSIILFRLL